MDTTATSAESGAGHSGESASAGSNVVLRCGFCLKLNAVDLTRAADRPQCGSCHKPMLLDRPVKVSQDDFEQTVLRADAPVLVDFYADWCQPCKMLAPMIDEIASTHVGTLLVTKLDTDQAPEIATRYAIRGVPTLILFQGGEEVQRSVGIMPDEIKEMVGRATGTAA